MRAETIGTVPRDHVVQFYEHDDDLVTKLGDYLADGLLMGEAAIVVATTTHLVGAESAMQKAGIDLDACRSNGSLVTVDARVAVSRIFVGGRIEPGLFAEEIGGLVRGVTRGGRRTRVFGEMVALLWDDGHVAAAIELEALWNELGRSVPFSLYCAYPAHCVTGHDDTDSFGQLCHLHSAVVGQSVQEPGCNDTFTVARAEDARSFACATHTPSLSRRFVADTLRSWGREELLDEALIVVTELATNAVIHARSEYIVAMAMQGDAILVSIRDASAVLPVLRQPTPTASSGRGLVLVAAIAQRWGTEVVGDGKVVWVELRS